MFYLLTVLILIASIALVLLVIVQKSKGGGLASPFASTNNIMGVRKYRSRALHRLVALPRHGYGC